jgi:hypothetical protein
MSAVIKWNTSASRQVTTLARPKWNAIRQGLALALVGQPLALMFGFAGLALASAPGGEFADRLDFTPDDADLIGKALIGGGLLGCLLFLAGQLRCLGSAPQGHGAKDLLYACLLCTLAVPACFAGAHFLGGDVTFTAIDRVPANLLELSLQGGGPVLQLAGLVLILGSMLLLCAFVRAVLRCLNDAVGVRAVTCYFWFVAFLLGGTAGVAMQARGVVPPGVYVALGLAWLLGLLGQGLLICFASRRIGRFLRGVLRPAGPPPARPDSMPTPGQVILEASAFLPRRG